MLFDKTATRIASSPQKLFLIDGAGAMLSAFLLGVVLVKFESFFGIPPSALYILASLPILFAIYDILCYQKTMDKSATFLKGIASINLSYCCLSLVFAIYHIKTVTPWGWSYIIVEILIVVALATIEFKVANRLTT